VRVCKCRDALLNKQIGQELPILDTCTKLFKVLRVPARVCCGLCCPFGCCWCPVETEARPSLPNGCGNHACAACKWLLEFDSRVQHAWLQVCLCESAYERHVCCNDQWSPEPHDTAFCQTNCVASHQCQLAEIADAAPKSVAETTPMTGHGPAVPRLRWQVGRLPSSGMA
jgi:hypothetical protein